MGDDHVRPATTAHSTNVVRRRTCVVRTAPWTAAGGSQRVAGTVARPATPGLAQRALLLESSAPAARVGSWAVHLRRRRPTAVAATATRLPDDQTLIRRSDEPRRPRSQAESTARSTRVSGSLRASTGAGARPSSSPDRPASAGSAPHSLPVTRGRAGACRARAAGRLRRRAAAASASRRFVHPRAKMPAPKAPLATSARAKPFPELGHARGALRAQVLPGRGRQRVGLRLDPGPERLALGGQSGVVEQAALGQGRAAGGPLLLAPPAAGLGRRLGEAAPGGGVRDQRLEPRQPGAQQRGDVPVAAVLAQQA